MPSILFKDLHKLLECPRSYYFSKVEGLVGEKGKYRKFVYTMIDALKKNIKKSSFSHFDPDFPTDVVPKEWFSLEYERKEALETLSAQLNRYLDYEASQQRKVLSINKRIKVSLPDMKTEVKLIVDAIFKKDNAYEGVIFKLSAPELSSAARKPENKPERSLELALMYLGLQKKYPGIKVSFYHLVNKDDKPDEMVKVYNHSVNKNIVTATFTPELAWKTVMEHLEPVSSVLEMQKSGHFSNESIYQPNCGEQCGSCHYSAICKKDMEPSIAVPPEYKAPSVRLNRCQQDAVECISSHLRIIAPPGSGKTATLTQRTKFLLESGVSYRNILLLSFTNKAVDELKERVIRSTWLCGNDIPVFTFHSFCTYVLNRYRQQVKSITGVSNPKIVTTSKRLETIMEFLSSCDGKIEGYSYANPLGDFGILRRMDRLVKNLLEEGTPIGFKEEFLAAGKNCTEYVKAWMKREGFLTYRDLLIVVKDLFLMYPEIPKELGETFQYIMVDEAQDMDGVQYEMVRSIGKYSLNVCICGDDDQSLYSFRNADVRNMMRFKDDFNCVDVVLDTNYRSASEIVNIANQFIQSNTVRLPKVVKAFSTQKGNIEFKQVQKLDDIALFVHSAVQEGYSPADIAIIARRRKTLEEVSYVLTNKGIPFRMNVNLLWEDSSYQRLASFLKVYSGKYSDIDIYAIKDVLRLNSSNEELEPSERIKEAGELFLKEYILRKEDLVSQIEVLCSMLNVKKAVASTITPLIAEYEVNDLLDLWSLLSLLEKYGEEVSLEDGCTYNAVQMLTAHASKGKEFPIVIIPDANEFKSEGSPEEVEEERRVLFVAMTRAKYRLYMGQKPSKKPSLFVDELVSILDTVSVSDAV